MTRETPQLAQPPGRSAGTEDRLPAPLDVFYVVQTTAGVIGKRQHRVCPPLYETRRQAQVELMHLETTSSGSGTYSIWKATAYVEPAEWLYDVVVADGSVIRLGDGDRRRPMHREHPRDGGMR
jgi:hypothetical protein